MFPDKSKLTRNANALLAMFGIAPVVYLVIAAGLTFGGRGLARNLDIVPILFVELLAVSIANIGVTAFFQTSRRIMAERARYDPLGRVYLIFSLGAVLSEAHSIYGLVLTLLSGSILYGIGFSLATWICLIWVRDKFKQNLRKLPDA
jgi:hypothetical protein